MKYHQNAGDEPFLPHFREERAGKSDVLMEGDGRLFPLLVTFTADSELPAPVDLPEPSREDRPVLSQRRAFRRALLHTVELLVVVAAVTVLLSMLFFPVL